MDKLIRIGVDTSKNVFQLHGVDDTEQPVLRRKLRRKEVLKFFAGIPPARVAMEACGASHHWARQLQALGHEVVLIPPQYVNRAPEMGLGRSASVRGRHGIVSMQRLRAVSTS